MASEPVMDMESADHVQKTPRRRKCKNHLAQLAEMFPDVTYHVAATYGSSEDQIYVMEVKVGEKVFQGIGPSKIKAKIMAAEWALISQGVLEALTVKPSDITEVCSSNDFSADRTESHLFYDFSKEYSTTDEPVPWDAESGDKSLSITSADGRGVSDDGAVVVEVDEEDVWSRFVGKTPLTIIVELQLEARYELLAETGDQLHPLFAMSVTIEGETFRAAGTSKKIAKARAARNALCKLYNLEFGTSENGMPIYEGNEYIWESYKEKLEKEAELLVQPGRNPLLMMSDFFPEAVFELNASADTSHFYTAQVTVLDHTYTGLGTTKTDAKTNAAANALEELRNNGSFAARERQVKADRRHLLGDRHSLAFQHPECKLLGVNKNAVAKLNILFRDRVRFCDLSETPVCHTTFTAFTVAASVDGRHYIGVGKTKKAARSAAAERALWSMRLWTEEDESVKYAAMVEVDEDPIEAVYRMKDIIAQEREMQSWEQAGWKQSQYPPMRRNPEIRGGMSRGRDRWNVVDQGWGDDYGWSHDPWSGPFQRDPGEWGDEDAWSNEGHWNDEGRWNRGRNQPVRGLFDICRERFGGPRGRGHRGGNGSETFHWNRDGSNSDSRGSRGRVVRNRAGRVLSGRGDSGSTRHAKPFLPQVSTPKTTPSSSVSRSEVTSAPPAVPLPQFSSHPNPPPAPPAAMSTISASNIPVNPAIGNYYSSANQNQAGLSSATQAAATYMPSTANMYMGGMDIRQNMTFGGYSTAGFMSAVSQQQNTTYPNTLPSYSLYGNTGYESTYGQGNYSLY